MCERVKQYTYLQWEYSVILTAVHLQSQVAYQLPNSPADPSQPRTQQYKHMWKFMHFYFEHFVF